VFLFKRILDFKKTESAKLDKRGAKRYPLGSKSQLKAKLALLARDGEGNPLNPEKHGAIDWGGQVVNLSNSGAQVRLHPAAVASLGDKCCLKLELDNLLFEIDATIAYFRGSAQEVACGIILNFPDAYVRKAYLQLMEPIVIGSTFEPVTGKLVQDVPDLVRQEFKAESETELKIWRDEAERNPKHFELLVHDYYVRGSTDVPGLQIGYRDGAEVRRQTSRSRAPMPMSADHKREVQRLFQLIVQNLNKGIPSELRKFLELFAV